MTAASLQLEFPGRPARAFTLIEVLLAVVIFGIVLVGIHAIFHGALRLRSRTTDALDAARPLLQTLAVLRRDLANIVPPGGTFAGPVETSPLVDGMNSQPSIRFCTAVGVLTDDAPWGDIQRVAYTLAASTNKTAGRELRRAVVRNLLPLNYDEIEEQPLLTGVETLEFWFYDGTSWRSTWDSTNEPTLLPRAIKVDLLLVATNADQARNRKPIELIVGLLVEPATNSSSSSSNSSAGGGA